MTRNPTVREVLVSAVRGDEVIGSVDSTYAGFDPGTISNVGLGKMFFGGLIANISKGRDAVFNWGDGAHGTELVMGAMKHVRKEGGLRLGLSFARLDKFLKFGPFGSYSKVYDHVSSGSRKKDGAVAVLIPQDRDTEQVKGQEGSTGSNKQIGEKLTDFLIAFAEKEDHGITGLWRDWSETFDDPSRISLGFRELEYDGKHTRVEGGVAARVKWKDKYHGAMAGVAYVGVKATDKRNSKAGAHQLNRQTSVNEKFLTPYASISQGAEVLWSDDSMSVSTRAIPLVGFGITMALDTENAITRVLSERGQVNPVETNQDMVFADTNAWVNHLSGTQDDKVKNDAWLYKQTASGYKPTTYKAWNGEEFVGGSSEPTPDLEKAKTDGLSSVNKMLNEAHQHGPLGSNAKTTRWVLHPAAADELTHIRSMVRTYREMLMHEKPTFLRKNIVRQIQAANKRAEVIMNDLSFWQTKWATSANTVSKSSSFGVSFGVRFGNISSVSCRPKTHRIFFGGDVRKQEANFSTPAVLKALAASAA